MTGTELQGQIQRIINDTNNAWSPTQYLEAINYSIRYVTKRRVDKNDPEFIFDLGIINGQVVPDNFMKFAGNVPVTIKDTGGQRQFFHTQSGTPSVKFYVMRPTLSALSDNIPMKSEHSEALKLCAAIYLKEQRGTYDMTKEKERLEALLA
jgi:hypothetical protein